MPFLCQNNNTIYFKGAIMNTKWEYKIIDHSNSTAMGYTNEETEEFKQKYKESGNWKHEMSQHLLNELGQDGWELASQNSANEIYLKRQI